MRKFLLLLIAAILCATLLLGCSPANTPPVNTPVAEATPTPNNSTPDWLDDDDDDSEFDWPDDDDDYQYYIEGPVLIIKMSEGFIDNYEYQLYDDGTYFEEMYYDAMVYITTERLLPSEYGQELETMAMYAGIFEEELFLTEIELPQLPSYPAFGVEYLVGANEDTRYCVDILIHTDGWDFRFHTSTPYDYLEDYWGTIESWIDSLDIFDGV
ncbi:MAG: hypothetical protein ACOYIR_07665 [Christensenellales bacterium]|jgi:hypothetical protein